MIELTEEERRKIYEEEKAKRETETSASISGMIIVNILTGLFLALLLTLPKYKTRPKIESFRKIYEGLPPE